MMSFNRASTFVQRMFKLQTLDSCPLKNFITMLEHLQTYWISLHIYYKENLLLPIEFQKIEIMTVMDGVVCLYENTKSTSLLQSDEREIDLYWCGD